MEEVRLKITIDLQSFSDSSLEAMLSWGCLPEDIYAQVFTEVLIREKVAFKKNFEPELRKINDAALQLEPLVIKMKTQPPPYNYLDSDMFKSYNSSEVPERK